MPRSNKLFQALFGIVIGLVITTFVVFWMDYTNYSKTIPFCLVGVNGKVFLFQFPTSEIPCDDQYPEYLIRAKLK